MENKKIHKILFTKDANPNGGYYFEAEAGYFSSDSNKISIIVEKNRVYTLDQESSLENLLDLVLQTKSSDKVIMLDMNDGKLLAIGKAKICIIDHGKMLEEWEDLAIIYKKKEVYND